MAIQEAILGETPGAITGDLPAIAPINFTIHISINKASKTEPKFVADLESDPRLASCLDHSPDDEDRPVATIFRYRTRRRSRERD